MVMIVHLEASASEVDIGQSSPFSGCVNWYWSEDSLKDSSSDIILHLIFDQNVTIWLPEMEVSILLW